jgi:twitching motility protein PilI
MMMSDVIASDNDGAHNKISLSSLLPDDEVSRSILAERAKVYAIVADSDTADHKNWSSYIKFLVGSDEYYGIPYADIQEIKRAGNVTRVPMSPAYVKGITYWHGKLIPVVDLAGYLNLGTTDKQESKPYIAVIVFEKQIIAFSFTDVLGVDSYQDSSLDASIAANRKLSVSHVRGIHAGRTIILNANNIVNDIAEDIKNLRSIKT